MAAAMMGVVESRELVNVLGAAGRRFAQKFTWDRAANDTLSHLEEIVAK